MKTQEMEVWIITLPDEDQTHWIGELIAAFARTTSIQGSASENRIQTH